MSRKDKIELLDPKIDYVFKRIFGEKGDEDILMSLINAILKGNPVIKELELLNTEYPKEGIIRKGCRFDILAKTDNNVTVNIEMQYRNNKNINDRIIYYSDKIFVNEYKTGDFYGSKKVISIWIFAENINDRKEPMSEIFPCYKGNKEDKWEVFTENKRIIIFELQKYRMTNDNFRDLLTNWVEFLKSPNVLEDNPLKLENEELDKAINKLEFMSKKDEERYYIQSMEDYEREKLSEKYWEGVEKEKKGLERGLKEGKIEGEKNKSTEIAKNMLNLNIDINTISKATGLPIEEINKLKEEK